MSIGVAAERIAESLKNDDWFWMGKYDDQRFVRKDFRLSVSLRGEVQSGPGSNLPGDRVPLNWSERRMLARAAKEALQVHIARIANNTADTQPPARGPKP
jgi:hypothetical protein